MKSVRKRFHDIGGKINKVVISVDGAIDIIEDSRMKGIPLDADQLLTMLRIGDKAAQEMNVEVRAVKEIAYKLCNPDDDLDHFLGG